MTDPKLIEAVARAYAKIADGAVYDAMPPESREMYAKRVMPIITAYEAVVAGDFGAGAAALSSRILSSLGFSQAESMDPGADPRRDRIAALVDRAMIAAAKGES